jgi:hypothetical protein
MISARSIQELLNSPSKVYTINECEEIKELLYILAEIEIESISTTYFTNNSKAA